MLLCIRCLTDMGQWQMYDNTVHNVNTATTTWRPNIFCIKFLLLLYFVNKSSFLAFYKLWK